MKSVTQKRTEPYDFTRMWNIKQKRNKQNKNKQTHRQQNGGYQRGGGTWEGKTGKRVKYVITDGGEHTIECTDIKLQYCMLEIYMLLTNVTSTEVQLVN